MFAKKIMAILALSFCLPLVALSDSSNHTLSRFLPWTDSLDQQTLANALGFIPSNDNSCGGYYLEDPFIYPESVDQNNLVEITGDEGFLSQHGTSTLEGKVTVTRAGQQITANKAYIYRNPTTGKLSAIDMIGDVHLREPNTLVIGKEGHYDFETNAKSLKYSIYRTSLSGQQILGPKKVSSQEMHTERKITAPLIAWGKADVLYQNEPKIYEFDRASFTTCPPHSPAWKVKGSHIVLNKNTGRGYATHARLFVKNVPVFYMPYLNFSIDGQRKTGFLWPTYGGSNISGPSLYTPFYWNMAPNYDMTIVPAALLKRGLQLSDTFRYLSPTSSGSINLTVLPEDQEFRRFQKSQEEIFANTTDPVLQSELNRLSSDSTTRRAFFWRDKSQFNDHWSSNINFNYAGDDYYMREFGNLNEITQDQLLQEANLDYKSEHWNFTGKLQAYQTLHPIDEPTVENQYRRLPQLVLGGDYPNQAYGLDYFITNEVTHFDILKMPGETNDSPIGNRINIQPGVNLPLSWASFYINPRVQVALTDYNLHQTADTDTSTNIQRSVPIFDVVSGVVLERPLNFFSYAYKQTLEPQVYYTYIPYRNQFDIPLFDTTVNTLTYDQLFNYNRFTSIDRIGDANQIGLGVTSRFLNEESGLEKIRLGIGEIIYFQNRRVTLCETESECSDNPDNPTNHYRLSPITGLINYSINPSWNFNLNSIWNPISRQLDNSTITLHYQSDPLHIINLGYNYAYNADPLSGVVSSQSENNLKVTDVSAAWPLIHDFSAVGRWSQNWNHGHLQNLLYGLQYDTCCWAVRMVGGRAFTNIDPNNDNKPQYTSEFYVQFSLKGLGNIGQDPTKLLSSISGYNTTLFGQDI